MKCFLWNFKVFHVRMELLWSAEILYYITACGAHVGPIWGSIWGPIWGLVHFLGPLKSPLTRAGLSLSGFARDPGSCFSGAVSLFLIYLRAFYKHNEEWKSQTTNTTLFERQVDRLERKPLGNIIFKMEVYNSEFFWLGFYALNK